MADETGRGEGSIGDDLFALGVTLLSLLIGRNPVPNIPDPHQYRDGSGKLNSWDRWIFRVTAA
ncbi:MAG: hypothetical protein P8N43_03355 [Alphaproteobacteria bacterium]|nr:hypothetical protein [Alphaproteobacteria bacterium]